MTRAQARALDAAALWPMTATLGTFTAWANDIREQQRMPDDEKVRRYDAQLAGELAQADAAVMQMRAELAQIGRR